MKIEHHRSSSTISYMAQDLDVHAMMRARFKGQEEDKSQFYRPVQKVIKVRQARNGTLVISFNGSLLGNTGLVSVIAGFSREALNALNEVLDHYAVKDFSEAECVALGEGYSDTEENLYSARKRGVESLAIRTILRASHAQKPVYTELMKPDISSAEHPLHDFYYDEAETIYGAELPFMRAATLRELVYKAFGFWRKDLIKLVTQVNARSLTWVSWFKGGLTPDQTVRVLRHFKENPLGQFDLPNLEYRLVRKIVRDMKNPTSLFNLAMAKHPMDVEQNYMLTTVWVDGEESMRDLKVNGWRALYERAMRVSAESLTGFTSRVPEGFFMLDGIERAGYTARILHDAKDYYTTGLTMDVCVGSLQYMQPAHDGEALHIRFDQGDKMAALLDLRKKQGTNSYYVKEFRGQKNSAVPDEKLLLDLVAETMQYELVPA